MIAEWMVGHRYLALFALPLFAYGCYRNWRREKLRSNRDALDQAGVSTMNYGDAELPDPRSKTPPSSKN